MVVSSKQLWAVICYNTFMVCEEVVKVDGKGLVIKPVSIFNGYSIKKVTVTGKV
jgi:hypothetical protein